MRCRWDAAQDSVNDSYRYCQRGLGFVQPGCFWGPGVTKCPGILSEGDGVIDDPSKRRVDLKTGFAKLLQAVRLPEGSVVKGE